MVTLIPFGFMSQAPLCYRLCSYPLRWDVRCCRQRRNNAAVRHTQLFDVLPIPITLSAVVKHLATATHGLAPKSRDPPYRRNLGSFALQVKGAGKPVVKGFADLHLLALHGVSK